MSHHALLKKIEFVNLPKSVTAAILQLLWQIRRLAYKGTIRHTDVSTCFIHKRSKRVTVGLLLSLIKKKLGKEKLSN